MTATPITSEEPRVVVETAPFQAEWPPSPPGFLEMCKKVLKVAYDILSIVIFPIGLLRLTIWWIKSRVCALGVCPGPINVEAALEGVTGWWSMIKALLYVIYSPESVKVDKSSLGQEMLRDYRGESIQLKTPDGASIDGIFIPGDHSPEKVILCGFGNGISWELNERGVTELKPLGASIMMINPRGVGKSTGSLYEKGYALDVYSAYEYLIHQKGIDPENILVIGESMGAANGVCGAALVQEKYPDKQISAINRRSFSTLDAEAQALLGQECESWIGWFLLGFLALLAKGLWLDMDVAAAWEKLKGKKIIYRHEKDGIILDTASLAKKVREIEGDNRVTTIMKMHVHQEDKYNGCYAHNRPFCSQELSALHHQIADILQLPPPLSLPESAFSCTLPLAQ